MHTELFNSLRHCETDVTGAMNRFSDDEELYISCLDAFLKDPTMRQLEASVRLRSWDDAFTAAHALKGLAGNMGFVPLFHATGELVVLIRAGRISEINDSLQQIKGFYATICSTIVNAKAAASDRPLKQCARREQ